MFCPYCATQNADYAKFCAGCGAKLIDEQSICSEPAQPAYWQQPCEPQPQPPAYQQPSYQQLPYQQPMVQQPAYQQPAYFPYQQNDPVPGKGMGVAGMVLGISSLVLCSVWYIAGPCALIGLILSIVSMCKARKAGKNNGFALTGIICCGIGLLIAVLLGVAVMSTLAGWLGGEYGSFPDNGQYY